MSLRQTGVIVTVRLTASEHRQLQAISQQERDTVSATIREALYTTYGIGGFGPSSLVSAAAVEGR